MHHDGEGRAAEDLTARARIRDAALKHFAEAGFAGATIREIARTAGVSPGLVRHHFGSKEDLRRVCDTYVLEALQKFNEQAAGGETLGAMSPSAEDRRALVPFQRYLVSAIMDDSSLAAPMFDGMVAMAEPWLARIDEQRPDPPAVDRRLRAALMTAQTMGIAAFRAQISRATGTDFESEEGDRKIALAMLDIYSHSLISPEYAASLRKALDESAPARRPDGSGSA